jgi:hypothetical protein
VLARCRGKLLATLEKADISKLLAAGWKPPEPITVKARDGATDLYGLMFKPTNLDPRRSIRSSTVSIPVRREAAWALRGRSPRRAATRRRWPNWDSSW